MTRAIDIATEFIKSREGLRLACYDDATGRPLAASEIPKGTATIGYGHTEGVKPGDRCTKGQADGWLDEDIQQASDDVDDVTSHLVLTEHQKAALISFEFNTGGISTGHDMRETLRSGLLSAVPLQMARWAHANGEVSAGLVARRQAEIELWDTPDEPATCPTCYGQGGEETGVEGFGMREVLHCSECNDTSKAPAPPRTLRRGDEGDDVGDLQLSLIDLGYSVPITSRFGHITETAVRQFQRSRVELDDDGVVGPATWKALAQAGKEGKP